MKCLIGILYVSYVVCIYVNMYMTIYMVYVCVHVRERGECIYVHIVDIYVCIYSVRVCRHTHAMVHGCQNTTPSGCQPLCCSVLCL